jgi:hypothetical protein
MIKGSDHMSMLRTPFCSLLKPVFSVLPPEIDPPYGAVVVHAVTMSTRIYTIFAAPLPNPAVFGNFDSYTGILSLIREEPSLPPLVVKVRLISSPNHSWSGSTTSLIPVSGDFAAIHPSGRATGKRGPAILRGYLNACRS